LSFRVHPIFKNEQVPLRNRHGRKQGKVEFAWRGIKHKKEKGGSEKKSAPDLGTLQGKGFQLEWLVGKRKKLERFQLITGLDEEEGRKWHQGAV